MNIRFADQSEIDQWDDLLARNPDGGNVFQSQEVSEAKRNNGWKPRYLMIDSLAVTVLEKSVLLLGAYWYLPKGPGATSTERIETILPDLRRFAAAHGVFVCKIEPEIIETKESRQQLRSLGMLPTPPVQPNNSTVIIDLSPSIDDILASLNQKGRHALRRAERDGVSAEAVPFTEENARLMYNLLRETAVGRFETSVRDFSYYYTFWKAFVDSGAGSLFFATYENRVVAGAFSMFLGKKGLYKDGASVREKTVYGASHLLQWEIMQWMKSRGVESYDLCGAPHSSRINDESHNFYGVGRFKTSFNKHVTDYVGCYDLPVRPFAYRIWQKVGQRIVVSLAWRIKKQLWF